MGPGWNSHSFCAMYLLEDVGLQGPVEHPRIDTLPFGGDHVYADDGTAGPLMVMEVVTSPTDVLE